MPSVIRPRVWLRASRQPDICTTAPSGPAGRTLHAADQSRCPTPAFEARTGLAGRRTFERIGQRLHGRIEQLRFSRNHLCGGSKLYRRPEPLRAPNPRRAIRRQQLRRVEGDTGSLSPDSITLARTHPTAQPTGDGTGPRFLHRTRHRAGGAASVSCKPASGRAVRADHHRSLLAA